MKASARGSMKFAPGTWGTCTKCVFMVTSFFSTWQLETLRLYNEGGAIRFCTKRKDRYGKERIAPALWRESLPGSRESFDEVWRVPFYRVERLAWLY